MSSLEERIKADIKDAMKSGRKDELLVLRTIMADAKNAAIAEGGERSGLDDEFLLKILRKGVKTRTDSIAAYREAGRDDLVEVEAFQVEVLERYLPAELPDEELTAIVERVIDETGASSKKDMGKVMGAVLAEVGARASGARVSKIVGARLS